MKFLLVYFGIGIAVLVALWVLFRKTGVDRKGLRILWGWSLTGDWGIILVPLLWPLVALLSLLWWLENTGISNPSRKRRWRKPRRRNVLPSIRI
jgi:hypothetical protein